MEYVTTWFYDVLSFFGASGQRLRAARDRPCGRGARRGGRLRFPFLPRALAGLYYKDAKVLFLGLDGAGKTTLLKVLKNGKVDKMAEPTTHAG